MYAKPKITLTVVLISLILFSFNSLMLLKVI